MSKIKLKWVEPINAALAFGDENYLALLFSASRNNYTGKRSFLAIKPNDILEANSFDDLSKKISTQKKADEILDRWFGYLSYDLKNDLEFLRQDSPTYVETPLIWLIKYNVILEFLHESNELFLHLREEEDLSFVMNKLNNYINDNEKLEIEIINIESNFTDQEYFEAFNIIQEHLKSGDIYQANLTRKFFGEIKCSNYIKFFANLMKISPTPYGSFLKFNNLKIISSSPEQFLNITKEGLISSRPIKGTARRAIKEEDDVKVKNALEKCPKNLSENLMIVDLMRNDLAKSCVTGSINVEELFQVNSFSTLHHMHSKITGIKKPEISFIDVIKSAFPPGSMTGCPKIKAMEICSSLEIIRRGIYSGALGYLCENGEVDLSVVIRTLVVKNHKFEFQVGGAITIESEANAELEETKTKSIALFKALFPDLENFNYLEQTHLSRFKKKL